MLKLYRSQLNKLEYEILVEGWERYERRPWLTKKYNELFTETERRTIRLYRNKFYAWYIYYGVPESLLLEPETFGLLKEAIEFFKSI